MQEPSVNEKTLKLSDPVHPLDHVLTCSFIYAADYYPLANKWLDKIITSETLLEKGMKNLVLVIEGLMKDLGR